MLQWTWVCRYPFEILISTPSDTYPGTELLDHMVVCFEFFEKLPYCFSYKSGYKNWTPIGLLFNSGQVFLAFSLLKMFLLLWLVIPLALWYHTPVSFLMLSPYIPRLVLFTSSSSFLCRRQDFPTEVKGTLVVEPTESSEINYSFSLSLQGGWEEQVSGSWQPTHKKNLVNLAQNVMHVLTFCKCLLRCLENTGLRFHSQLPSHLLSE